MIVEEVGWVNLNSDWPQISGSPAGYRFYMLARGILEERRSPTEKKPTPATKVMLCVVIMKSRLLALALA